MESDSLIKYLTFKLLLLCIKNVVKIGFKICLLIFYDFINI